MATHRFLGAAAVLSATVGYALGGISSRSTHAAPAPVTPAPPKREVPSRASSPPSAVAPAPLPLAPSASSPPPPPPPPPLATSVLEAIGNTPLIELRSLGPTLPRGARVLAKCEFLNPGGSVKDRAALSIVLDAEARGVLLPGGTLVEGTGGNTGIGLALVAAARGYKCVFTMPPATSSEKVELARSMGARVEVCPAVPFTDPSHYYQRAQAIAKEIPGAVWCNQFEGHANARAHFETTGPEIWAQAGGHVDGLALAAGTGGTIGGLASYLRTRNPALRVFLIDPPGSSLAAYVRTGAVEPSPGNSINEGIGIGRITENFRTAGHIDRVFDGVDQEAVDMAYFLLLREGLWVGPSAALNVVAAVKAARELGEGATVVTVLCDGGARYGTKLWRSEWLKERGLAVCAAVTTGGSPGVA